jgi:uncharacterized membrane-anchored protein YhcB (DUF1043 family)
MPRGAEQSAVHSVTGATSQQPQTSREGLELSVELEQARQQIITLRQELEQKAAQTARLSDKLEQAQQQIDVLQQVM